MMHFGLGFIFKDKQTLSRIIVKLNLFQILHRKYIFSSFDYFELESQSKKNLLL